MRSESGLEETITIMVRTALADAETSDAPLTLPARVGSVKLGEKLGEGASGVVMAGFDEALNRPVAVKFLHNTDRDSVARHEIVEGLRSAARVRHPNIVTIHSVDAAGDLPFVVMERVGGGSLRDVLRKAAPLDTPLTLHIMIPIADAVAALHDSAVIHRDLKPANILFDRDARPYVCDFGLACTLAAMSWGGSAANIGGSPLYMAPEMFEGRLSPQSDVYALGAVLFEMLVGEPAFKADTLSDMKARHATAPLPLEKLAECGVGAGMIEVVERAMNKRHILRYKNAGRLGRALAEQVTNADDARLRSRLNDIIVGAPRSDAAAPAESSPAMTTFDLLRARAAEKRRRANK
ncbi:MAG: serine/threonine protein kinase [Phycisphaerales bacterium]|nr:serine/threonine protein kinase [Phycisphaerales bacterium]